MKIVVKIGTQSILSQNAPSIIIMDSIVDQITQAIEHKHQIILVSSGAVGFGRSIFSKYSDKKLGSSIGEKQLLASIGQHKLIEIYANMFKKHEFLVSQILLTKQDFYTRKHYLNISRLIKEIMSHDYIIPIINENDSVAIEELMFTDNDELAGLIAALIDADKLIILSNVEGIYTDNPNLSASKLIDVIDPNKGWPEVSSSRSVYGRGGMITKITNAKKMSKLGIQTHIASVEQPNVINRIINGESVGTHILSNRKSSNIRKWVAYSVTNGKIYINWKLDNIIKSSQRAISILPIGIDSYIGSFKKGDVLEILNLNQEIVGFGVARYDSEKLKDYLGKNDNPPLIHYDYLYII